VCDEENYTLGKSGPALGLVFPGGLAAVARFAHRLQVGFFEAEFGIFFDGDDVVHFGGGFKALAGCGIVNDGFAEGKLIELFEAEFLPCGVVASLAGRHFPGWAFVFAVR
jgi:hypothetical protein